jgi:hypothetical protein
MKRFWTVLFVVGAALPAQAKLLPDEYKDPVELRRFTLDIGAGSLAYRSGNIGGGSGAWNVAFGYTPFRFTTIEAGYTGAVGNASGAGNLVATMVEGALRVNPIPGYRFAPYALAGVGWGGFHETVFASDNATVTVPLGAGFDVHVTDRIDLGARFTYRIVAADSVGERGASADNWSTITRIGARF